MRLTSERRLLLERRTGGLSRPSKLPGWSYSLPAGKQCHVGSKILLNDLSPCFYCYARREHHLFPKVIEAEHARLKAVKFSPTWVEDMTELIGSKQEKYFCWHDSGDLQSINHLQKICKVCAALPDYYFWLPTMEIVFVQSFRSMGGKVPPNLTIRISSPFIDSTPKPAYEVTSSVNKDPALATCPAPRQGNRCGGCRQCWDHGVPHVIYGLV